MADRVCPAPPQLGGRSPSRWPRWRDLPNAVRVHGAKRTPPSRMEAIKVFARVKPAGAGAPPPAVVVEPSGVRTPDAVFPLAGAFGPESTQEQVFDAVGRSICDAVLAGFNGLIFAVRGGGVAGRGGRHSFARDRGVVGGRSPHSDSATRQRAPLPPPLKRAPLLPPAPPPHPPPPRSMARRGRARRTPPRAYATPPPPSCAGCCPGRWTTSLRSWARRAGRGWTSPAA